MLRILDRLFTALERSVDVFPDRLPEKPPATLFRFVLHYARPFWWLILLNAFFAAGVALVEVSMFAFLGELVDWLAATTPDRLLADHGWELLGMALVVVVLYPLLDLLGEAVSQTGLMGNFPMRIRWQAHRYLLRQSVGFFQDDFAGRIAARMMQTALAVREVVLKTAELLLYVIVYFLSALVLFGSSDWRLVLPMLAWLIGYFLMLRFFIPRMRAASEAQAAGRAEVTGRVVDSYSHITTVKMFADAAHEDAYAREGMRDFLQRVHRSMRISTGLSVSLATLNALLIFAVAATAVLLWHQGAISAGAIAFAVGLVLRMIGMSHWIMWEVAGLFENIGVVMDGIETLSRDRTVTDRDGAPALSVPAGAIEWDDIHFNYGRDPETGGARVVDGLSLSIRPGEKVGLVGRSGAGKSTLVNLLLRFHDLEKGSIRIDGQDIAGISQDSLRAHIGMVTQDTSLLHRSVGENISYGRADASRAEVEAAARAAEADAFIRDLVDGQGRRGYDAQVGERGVKLSGGQRQRIAIARVLLKDAPILVLDEATSALDSEVEAAIQESLYRLMQGKTVLAIAHRLSTIAAMDRLVVMDGGRIVEEGRHDDLIARGGLYADLWARQSGGFIAFDPSAATGS